MIHYVKGDATKPIGNGTKVLVHVVNDVCAWGRGFTGAISKQWRQPERMYRAWAQGKPLQDGTPPFALGAIQFVPVSIDVVVVNMVAQHGLGGTGERVTDLPALHYCMSGVAKKMHEWGLQCAYDGKPIPTAHMPRIGCGLGGSSWQEVEPLVADAFRGLDVFVYDYDGKRNYIKGDTTQ